jgi:hypothetical protein
MRAIQLLNRSTAPRLLTGVLLTAAVALAQSADQNSGWRRSNDQASNQAADSSTPLEQADPGGAQSAAPSVSFPASLTIPAGTFITVRSNQLLSSDRNQVGDFFSATLSQPVVVDGIVVAQRGQTVSGRVAEVDKGSRTKNPARLGVQMTSLTAVDGQQVPVQTLLAGRDGHFHTGRDVGTVATTTGVGAVIGSAVGWGTGAAIGAGAGAMAGLAGVLLGHGAPAVVYPESLLTFRLEAPVTVATDRAPQAFRYVEPNDYPQQPPTLETRVASPPPYAAPYPYYAPYPYAYPYPYYAPYWGPSFGLVIGRPYYYGGGFYRFRR